MHAGDERRRQGDGALFSLGVTFPPVHRLPKFSAADPARIERRGTRGSHLSPISPTLTSAGFPAEFESINSIAGSNAAKTRQAKSGLIPVRCVSRLQSIEQKIQLPASGQAEETSDSRAVWPAGAVITPH